VSNRGRMTWQIASGQRAEGKGQGEVKKGEVKGIGDLQPDTSFCPLSLCPLQAPTKPSLGLGFRDATDPLNRSVGTRTMILTDATPARKKLGATQGMAMMAVAATIHVAAVSALIFPAFRAA